MSAVNRYDRLISVCIVSSIIFWLAFVFSIVYFWDIVYWIVKLFPLYPSDPREVNGVAIGMWNMTFDSYGDQVAERFAKIHYISSMLITLLFLGNLSSTIALFLMYIRSRSCFEKH